MLTTMRRTRSDLSRGRLAAPLACFLVLASIAAPAAAQARLPPAAGTPFTTSLALDEMRGRQAVLETDAGTIVIDLLPDAAPNHVGYFMKLAREGAYDGTTFHRLIRYGIIQGGDPLSKDPAKRAVYGTGGLGVLRREPNEERHTRGAVSAVLQPGKPDSAGAQFFICVTDQPALDGQYTVFGRVSDGLDVAQRISEIPTDPDGKATERVVIQRVTIRDAPPPEPIPFAGASPDVLGRQRATLVTSLGPIVVELFADRAPEHARNFLALAALGVFDGTAFHRVVPGFVVQTGSLHTRAAPLSARQQQQVGNLAPEFNDTRHERGIVSMARGDAPDSASTSFFICLGPAPGLDGKYTVFGRVAEGLDVLARMEAVPVEGETPLERVELKTVTIEERPH
jgi:cyclophilin family peptidyl-prolyl cis-trans isomerase